MKRKGIAVIVSAVLIVLLAVGVCSGCGEKPAEEPTDLGQYSEFELFQSVPAMPGEDIQYAEAIDAGGGDYVILATGADLGDYQEYLSVLEENGFTKVLNNGENGIEGYVYTTDYQKGDMLLVVTYIDKLQTVTITVNEKAVLSDHLFYDESYIAGNVEGAQTSFHLIEMVQAGNSFAIQMKDGHFLMFDGGMDVDLPPLLEYLESLTPEGEKPVVDAWFISHAHGDHMGFLATFAQRPDYVDRISVEALYFDTPSYWQLDICGGDTGRRPDYCNGVSSYLKASDGSGTKLYHPHLGDRYYFSDFTIDIIYTSELLRPEQWDTSNSASTVMMLTIEGQKMLLTGDTDWCCQVVYTDMFDPEYFDLTVYQAPHHAINVYKQITNRLGSIQTVIFPTNNTRTTFGEGNVLSRTQQNKHLVSLAKEALAWGDGTKVLRFPYEVGSYESLPQKHNLED